MRHCIFRVAIVFLGVTSAAFGAGAADGDLLWAHGVGGPLSDKGNAIAVDSAGNVYTVGQFSGVADFDPDPDVTLNLASGGYDDIFVQKLSAEGDLVWVQRFGAEGRDSASAVAVDDDGNVHVTGYFQNTVDFDPDPDATEALSASQYDIFVLKLDTDGNLVWARRMGGTGADLGYGIAVDSSGNVFTTGQFSLTVDFDPDPDVTANLTSGGNSDIFVQKLDASGKHVWVRGYGVGGTDIGRGIALDSAGNVYTTGFFQGTVAFGSVNLSALGSNIFVHKLDNDGNVAWAHSIGAAGDDRGHAIAVDGAGNVYTTGFFHGTVDFNPDPLGEALLSAFSPTWDIFVHKLDTDGNHLWARRMGGEWRRRFWQRHCGGQCR